MNEEEANAFLERCWNLWEQGWFNERGVDDHVYWVHDEYKVAFPAVQDVEEYLRGISH